MQAPTVIIVVRNDSTAPPRRQVMVGRVGPGIAKVLVDELFAERDCVETEGQEVANG